MSQYKSFLINKFGKEKADEMLYVNSNNDNIH